MASGIIAPGMFDLVRTSLHRAISTTFGDRFTPVRVPKDLARRMNTMLGEPLCSKDELERRRAARTRLDELQRSHAQGGRIEREQAPVMVYYEKDRNERMLTRIKESLDARKITFTVLDVTGDQPTKEFVLLQAKCKEDDLPVVFVGGTVVGGYESLVDWEVSGRLEKALGLATTKTS